MQTANERAALKRAALKAEGQTRSYCLLLGWFLYVVGAFAASVGIEEISAHAGGRGEQMILVICSFFGAVVYGWIASLCWRSAGKAEVEQKRLLREPE